MQAPASLICFSELHEEFEEQGVVYDVFRALRPVYQLLDETLLDSHYAVIHHLRRIVAEESMNDQVKQSLHFQVIL